MLYVLNFLKYGLFRNEKVDAVKKERKKYIVDSISLPHLHKGFKVS